MDGFMDAQPLSQYTPGAVLSGGGGGGQQNRCKTPHTARYPVYGTIWNLFLVWIGAVEGG